MEKKQVDQRFLEKIQKLLQVTEDRGASPTEAATAARHVEALLRKHNLEMADLQLEELQAGEGLGTEWARASVNPLGNQPQKSLPDWAGILAVAVAELFDCHARQDRLPVIGIVIRFFGYKTDVVIAKWMFEYLCKEIVRWSKNVPESDIWATSMTKKAYLADYRTGMAQELTTRLRDLLRQRKDEIKTTEAAVQGNSTGTTSTALVIAKQRAVEEKFGPFNYTQASYRASSANSRGRVDGTKVNINPNPIANTTNQNQVRSKA